MPRKISLKTLRKRAWQACSQYVRQSAADWRGYATCFTCDRQFQWKAMDAGHGIDGRHNAVLFDTDIIRIQCKNCNSKGPGGKCGNHKVFAYKLIKEHGLEWWEAKLAGSKQIVKYTRSDYEQIAADFNLKTQQLSVERKSEKWRKNV